MLSEAELPPAVGLVLKLASESPLARAPAVRCVRGRVRSAAPGAAGGTLDAMRLAVLQHRDVASAVLADIDADAKGAKPAAAPDAQVGLAVLGSPLACQMQCGRKIQQEDPWHPASSASRTSRHSRYCTGGQGTRH